MTDQTPDQIRADIERTRADLGEDVDALADKVRPSSIVGRQADKVRSAMSSVKDTVMGTVSDAGGAASNLGHAVAEAPRNVTSGHPMAVGLVAFGIGLLASALLPASQKEKELAAAVKEKAEPLAQQLGDVATEVGEHLRGPAMDAAEAIKETARDAADSVRSEASSAKDDVAESARSATSGS